MARDPRYDCLFEPIAIGPHRMKNRFFQVPHCTGAGSDRPGTQAMHRKMKAEGGWGAVCTEACSIGPENDTEPHSVCRLWDETDVINLRPMTEAVHAHGALAGVELWHCGQETANLESRAVPAGVVGLPSDAALQMASYHASTEEVRAWIGTYAAAARRAEQAGFDLIYVYGSHRAVPIQFLSPRYNRRDDCYGGSFENRARFWIECLAGVKEATGGRCAAVARISIDQLLGPEGIEVAEDGLRFVELAEREGVVDLWDVNISQLMEWGEDAGASRFYKANHQAPWVKHVKTVAKAPVVCVGRLTSPDDMVAVIQSGQADLIGAARPSIADPFLPKKIEEGRLDDIRECIGCNVCVSRWERGARMVCTQNATANEEFRRGWHPERFEKAANPCGVLVVGAGPAGLECARVLGLRGYDVHLVERNGEAGGHLREAARYPGLSEWARVVTYRETQLKRLKNVEMHLGTEIDARGVLEYGAEKVVLATGAAWAADGFSVHGYKPIPGADAALPSCATPEQVMAGKPLGKRVLVLDADGYFTAVGMAELLADAGHAVTIATHFDAVAPMTEFTLERDNLRRLLKEKGIETRAGVWVERVEHGNALTAHLYDRWRDGYRRASGPVPGEPARRQGRDTAPFACDSLVLVTARRPRRALYEALAARQDEWAAHGLEAVYQIGDCYAPRMIAEAVFDGHRLAREFESADPQKPLPYRRERMVWGQTPV